VQQAGISAVPVECKLSDPKNLPTPLGPTAQAFSSCAQATKRQAGQQRPEKLCQTEKIIINNFTVETP